MLRSPQANRIPFFLVALCSLFGLHCKTQSVTPDNNIVFLMPMKVGNTWYYQADLVDSLGSVITSTVRTVNIYTDTLIGSSLWYGFLGEGFRMNRPDGVWQLQPNPFLEFPISTGDSILRGNGTTYTHLLSKGTKVTVPAGTYICYEYSETNPANGAILNKLYLALSLGIIKQEAFNGISSYPDTVMQLITYTVLQ